MEPSKTRVERKLPFIPTEEEIDQLIAGYGKKTAVRINNPVKGSLAKVVKVPAKTVAMINALPKISEYIFNTNLYTIRKIFYKQSVEYLEASAETDSPSYFPSLEGNHGI